MKYWSCGWARYLLPAGWWRWQQQSAVYNNQRRRRSAITSLDNFFLVFVERFAYALTLQTHFGRIGSIERCQSPKMPSIFSRCSLLYSTQLLPSNTWAFVCIASALRAFIWRVINRFNKSTAFFIHLIHGWIATAINEAMEWLFFSLDFPIYSIECEYWIWPSVSMPNAHSISLQSSLDWLVTKTKDMKTRHSG